MHSWQKSRTTSTSLGLWRLSGPCCAHAKKTLRPGYACCWILIVFLVLISRTICKATSRRRSAIPGHTWLPYHLLLPRKCGSATFYVIAKITHQPTSCARRLILLATNSEILHVAPWCCRAGQKTSSTSFPVLPMSLITRRRQISLNFR